MANVLLYIFEKKLDEEPSSEHVIPLSLGACNEFVINVGKEIDNKYESKIEGKFSKDLLAGFLRLEKKNVGHSKISPCVKMRGKNNDNPITLTITGVNQYIVYNHKLKKNEFCVNKPKEKASPV